MSSGSDDDKTPPALRRLRQLGNPALTGSDMEVGSCVCVCVCVGGGGGGGSTGHLKEGGLTFCIETTDILSS